MKPFEFPTKPSDTLLMNKNIYLVWSGEDGKITAFPDLETVRGHVEDGLIFPKEDVLYTFPKDRKITMDIHNFCDHDSMIEVLKTAGAKEINW